MGQIEDMQVFIRVVEANGVGRAAEQLGIAVSAVSRRLSELEKRLGVTLINRTTRTLRITESGSRYYRQALGLVDHVTEIENNLQDAESALAGTIRISVPLSFGLLHLGPVIDIFMKQYPLIKMDLEFSDRQVDVVEEGFDLALRIANIEDSSLQARKICACHQVLAASRSYLEEHGTPHVPEELEQHRVLKYSQSPNRWAITDKDGNLHSPRIEPIITANNGDFLVQMACAGHGLVAVPTFIMWKALASDDLIRILPEYVLPSANAWFVYPRTRFLPGRTKSLINFVINRLGTRPYWDQALNIA